MRKHCSLPKLGFVVSLFILFLGVIGYPSISYSQIERTAHNLSVTSSSKTTSGQGLGACKYCHTPHNVTPARALWNRSAQGTTYKLYESSTLEAELKQPTGSSKLCLSCHDGTIALSNLRVGPRLGNVGLQKRLTGRPSLETDLSDDHPISFVYDLRLVAKNRELVDPSILPREVTLDQDEMVQCTSCHDPHTNENTKFLVMDERNSELCLACHRIEFWQSSSHASSPASLRGVGSSPFSDLPSRTVSENGCLNCHDVHGANHPERLIRSQNEEENCFVCHNGAVAKRDVEGEFRRFNSHPVDRSEWVHDPRENPFIMGKHVTCTDCHDPHSSQVNVRGISSSGSEVEKAIFEYQICFKCHGVSEELSSSFIRKDNITNTRLEMDPANPSYHPVVEVGKNPNINGLESNYDPSSIINCSDCHNPHGSIYEKLIKLEYQQEDNTPESFQSYALCYKCHDRSVLLSDAGGFPHRLHVVDSMASCAACHDAHGSRENPSLINFMQQDKTGQAVVTPSLSGRLEYQDLGLNRGQCFLTCHESNHDPFQY